MIRNISKIKWIIMIALGLVLVSPITTFAYKLLEPLPGLDSENVRLSNYLGWLFPFILTVVAILAVIMIVIGGLELIGAGSEGLRTSGKKKIEGAIYGLVLALSSYLILYTINPDLVNMSLSIDPVTLTTSESQHNGFTTSDGRAVYICVYTYKDSGFRDSRIITGQMGAYSDMGTCNSACSEYTNRINKGNINVVASGCQ